MKSQETLKEHHTAEMEICVGTLQMAFAASSILELVSKIQKLLKNQALYFVDFQRIVTEFPIVPSCIQLRIFQNSSKPKILQ